MSATFYIFEGNAVERLREMDAGSVQTCITSPPYWGLRDYGTDSQLGLEATAEEYVANLVEVFREVKRVLRDDGTLWLNLGDSYAGANYRGGGVDTASAIQRGNMGSQKFMGKKAPPIPPGCKPKDLVGIPWAVAFALRADGWYLRSDIIWAKPNLMPESITDRPTKAHEYLFLLSKSPRYYYDAAAIRDEAENAGTTVSLGAKSLSVGQAAGRGVEPSGNGTRESYVVAAGRNKRTVWTVTTSPFPGAHFATFPPKLIEPCVLAGAAPGETVLDPFAGSGTAGVVALRHDRSFVGVELNPDYALMARHRIVDDAPLLNVEARP